jgi:uncharacterized membrane protein
MEQAMSRFIFNHTTGLIRRARRTVGRVRPDGAGRFAGIIGTYVATAASATQAFHEVAAQALGYPNHAALRAHNANVRRTVRERTRQIRARRFEATYSPPRPAQTAEQLTAQLQRERAEIGEPPLTAEQIAVWTRNVR